MISNKSTTTSCYGIIFFIFQPAYSLFSPSLAKSILSRKDEVDMTCFCYYIVLSGSKVYPDVFLQFKVRIKPNSVGVTKSFM